MTTALAKRPTAMKSEALAKYIEARFVAGVSQTLKELAPYIKELWRRLKAGETVQGCTTQKEYCEQVLGKTVRAVRYALKGGNPTSSRKPKRLPGETVSPRPALPAGSITLFLPSGNVLASVGSVVSVRRGQDTVVEKVVSVTGGRCAKGRFPVVTENVQFNKNHFDVSGLSYVQGNRIIGLASEAVDAEFVDTPNVPPSAEVRSADEQPALPAPEYVSNRELKRRAYRKLHPELEKAENSLVDKAIYNSGLHYLNEAGEFTDRTDPKLDELNLYITTRASHFIVEADTIIQHRVENGERRFTLKGLMLLEGDVRAIADLMAERSAAQTVLQEMDGSQ